MGQWDHHWGVNPGCLHTPTKQASSKLQNTSARSWIKDFWVYNYPGTLPYCWGIPGGGKVIRPFLIGKLYTSRESWTHYLPSIPLMREEHVSFELKLISSSLVLELSLISYEQWIASNLDYITGTCPPIIFFFFLINSCPPNHSLFTKCNNMPLIE